MCPDCNRGLTEKKEVCPTCQGTALLPEKVEVVEVKEEKAPAKKKK